MIRFLSISQNTFLQTIRQPIFSILILVTFGVLILAVPLAGWTMGVDYTASDEKTLMQYGLTTLLVSGLFIGAFSASVALSREIEDKTALTVITKPVDRATFVLGKFAGVAGAVTLAYYICGIVLLMTLRHGVMSSASETFDMPVIVFGVSALVLSIAVAAFGNFFFGWAFTSASIWSALTSLSIAMGLIGLIGTGWTIVPFGEGISPQWLVGMLLIFMAVMVLVAFAIAASTRLGQIMTLMVCVGVFVVGSIHPFLFGMQSSPNLAIRLLGWVAPNLSHFYPLDALTTGNVIPMSYVGAAAGYGAVYAAAVLAIGAALFQRRQLAVGAASATMPGAVALLSWIGQAGALATAMVALVSLSRASQAATAWPAGRAGGLLAAAAAAWLLWGCFGRGSRWAYRVVLVLTALVTAWRGATLLAGEAIGPLNVAAGDRLLVAIEAILAAAVLAVLLFPKTRHHFDSVHS